MLSDVNIVSRRPADFGLVRDVAQEPPKEDVPPLERVNGEPQFRLFVAGASRSGPGNTLSEDPPHFFICFSSKDQAIALEVVEFLEAEGLKCWISSRDILPGDNYQESIVTALEGAHGIVFLFSEASIASGEIRKELSLASSGSKPILPLRLSPVMPTGALRYELATHQWIDIFPDRQKALGTLVRTVRQVLGAPAGVGGPRVGRQTEGAAAPDPAPRDPSAGMPVAGAGDRPPGIPIIAIGGAEFERIRELLARHIGPIAKIYIQQAAAEARTTEDFCERLAAQIGASADRTEFRKAVRTHLQKVAELTRPSERRSDRLFHTLCRRDARVPVHPQPL